MQLFQINYLQMTDVKCFTLQPNGRFETGKKICLSMSAHHPETWQPSWSSKFVLGIELSAHCFLLQAIYLFSHSVRTVLLAIIGFMPSKGGGAIGALDYTSEERKTLARK